MKRGVSELCLWLVFLVFLYSVSFPLLPLFFSLFFFFPLCLLLFLFFVFFFCQQILFPQDLRESYTYIYSLMAVEVRKRGSKRASKEGSKEAKKEGRK